jgi:hypothetical protein
MITPTAKPQVTHAPSSVSAEQENRVIQAHTELLE